MATKKSPTKAKTPPGAADQTATEAVATESAVRQGGQTKQDDLVEKVTASVLDKITLTDAGVIRMFESQALNDEQQGQVDRIRKASAALAQVIVNETRNGADRQAAIRKIREASMTAVQAVALG